MELHKEPVTFTHTNSKKEFLIFEYYRHVYVITDTTKKLVATVTFFELEYEQKAIHWEIGKTPRMIYECNAPSTHEAANIHDGLDYEEEGYRHGT